MANGSIAERGVLTASDEAWDVAVRAAEVIGPLAGCGTVGLAQAQEAAARLGVSWRQVYVLVGRWRAGEGVVSDLLPARSSGGRGGGRLPEQVEAVISEVLRTRYLARQRRTVAVVHREIARCCRMHGLPVPSRGAVARRIARLEPVAARTAREGSRASRELWPAGGMGPEVTGLLERVQIDHTPVDVIVVDERHRLAIGRPYLTVAIDEASRCLVGMVVTLEAPSATSVGLCLAHAALDKRAWLERLGVEASWPMSGKPRSLYLDNAAEFRSEALRRGCEQHGIALDYRPKGLAHFGGIVERLIGTLMAMVHEVPGTTFSNTVERGTYDSDAKAVLTLRELERWLALSVACYHGQVHETLGRTPGGVWVEKVAEAGAPAVVTNETAFLIDFLPVIRRALTRTGFTIDHVQYFSPALRAWISRREQLGRFVLRRDPRDISRIWALDPEGGAYIEVPYRTLSRPPISAWEQQAAIAHLREQGRAEVDENALFAMVARMRAITDEAAVSTRKARRDRQRRDEYPAHAQSPPPLTPPARVDKVTARPFEEIEQW